MFSHLKSEEFVSLLEGIALDPKRIAHLDGCSRCTETLASTSETYRDVTSSFADAAEVDVHDVDWQVLRSSVRDQLLARSVKRKTTVRRWTGWRPTPSPAWGLAFTLLLTVALFAGLTANGPTPGNIPVATRSDDIPLDIPLNDGLSFYMDESELTEADGMAWAETEIFSALNELEAEEAELLRELIASAYDEELGNDGGLY